MEYTPASSKKDKGVLVPTNMRDPLRKAMAALEDRVGPIDKFVTKQLDYESVEGTHGVFMGLQIDAIGASIDQIGQGKAVVIADQTGIGKGRQAAAIIRWAEKQGKTPIFISVKPQLFSDMYGDLADIGSHDIHPQILNADESIALPNGTAVFGNNKGRHRATLEQIRDTAKLPEDRNALFATYSQVNTANLQREVLRALAPNAVFVLDESHNAAGESSTGEFMQSLLDGAHGVVFLSATYAKRPDNMPLYSRTDIGLAIKDKSKLEDAMAMGGLPLQTVISNNLVQAGQMFRRERSYDGVNINQVVATGSSKEHRELADKVTEALRAITKADRAFHNIYVKKLQNETKGETVVGGGNKLATTVQHTEFAAVVHNFVRQMLLALKADEAADRAIAALKNGEKPIIAVEQTMGSFLQEYAANNRIGDGQPLGDFSYRTVLGRALERSRALVKTDVRGNKTNVAVALGQLDSETLHEYGKAQAVIDALKMDLPMSPIDWMRDRLQKAGHTVAEITGRTLAVDYTDPKRPVLSTVPTEELSTNGKVATTRKFNNGGVDAVILNVAGSTGISLHTRADFKDLRQRKMIVAQPAQDINIFMQMLGRVHRTGQVSTPNYDILSVDLPAEKRPSAMLSKKMKSLNANTSSNTESATSVKAADMLNKYGDDVVAQYLSENPALADDLDVEPYGENNKPVEDIARRATGRLALMPVAVQEEFYRNVEQSYNDTINYLNETNQNDLEPRTFDYEAKETASQVMVAGERPESPFGADAVYNEFSIKSQAKPITYKDVQSRVVQALDGKTEAQHLQAMLGSLQTQYEAWRKDLDPASISYSQGGVTAEIARNFIQGHPVGKVIAMSVNGDLFNAVVTNIESSHKGAGNPFSMSKINVSLATTGPQPFIKVPATKLSDVSLGPLLTRPSDVFANHRPPARETAKIVTGNLLAAYGELQDAKGTIINFTKSDGSVEQGILLPKKFDLQKNTIGGLAVKTAGGAMRLLSEYSKPEDARVIGLATRDGNLRVTRGATANQVVFTTPKAKARGGQFFLDPAIVKATGDWVSSGNVMRATVGADKAKAALDAVMKKAALYVPRSMAEEGAKLMAGGAKPSGVTMRSSVVPGLDIAAEFASDQVMKFYRSDVAPALGKLMEHGKVATKHVAQVFAPRAFANPDSLDNFMKMKGEQEYSITMLERAFRPMEKLFDKMSHEANVDFVTRIQTGERQPTPELEEMAQALSAALDGQRQAENEAMNLARKPGAVRRTLTSRENYFPNRWASKPNNEQGADNELARVAAIGRARSPLEGSKKFNKQQSYTLASGIEAGGKPAEFNPVRIVQNRIADGMKLVTAKRMVFGQKQLGRWKYFNAGERLPEGWAEINDKLAQVYFPAESGEGMIEAGRWAMPENDARLLNNYLSRDWFKDNPVGKTLTAVKMAATSVELSFSTFHYANMGVESVGSQIGLGLMQAINNGIAKGDGGKFIEGVTKALTAPAAPYTMSRLGGSAMRAMADLPEFLKTERGQDFLKAFPDAPDMIRQLFHGGLTTQMPREYRTQWIAGMKDALQEGNYFGAVVRAVPALAEAMMKPLFEYLIPRLKMGYAMQVLAQLRLENAEKLYRGDVTPEALARKAVDAAENNFGEVNYSNFFWDNSFKGGMQLYFRAFSWKLTNWRSLGSAAVEQKRLLADPLKVIRDDVRGRRKGADRKGEEYIPKISLNAARILGVSILGAVLATVWDKVRTGKYPWEFLEEDREKEGKNAALGLMLELSHPRMGGTDGYTGLPTRGSLPIGTRDYLHAVRDPRGYIDSSLAGFVSKGFDTLDNRDFRGNYIYDPNGPGYQKMRDILTYNMPLPISAQTLLQDRKKKEYSGSKMSLFGLSKASPRFDMSPLERYLQDVSRSKHMPQTPEQEEAYAKKMANLDDLPGDQVRAIQRKYDKSFLERVFGSAELPYGEAQRVYDHLATPQEQDLLYPALERKRIAASRSGTDGEGTTADM